MNIKGKKSFTLSGLSELELVVIQAALKEYHPRHIEADASGSVAIQLFEDLQTYRDSLAN
jgi:hypothetical protein